MINSSLSNENQDRVKSCREATWETEEETQKVQLWVKVLVTFKL